MVECTNKMVSDLDARLGNNFGVEGHLLLLLNRYLLYLVYSPTLKIEIERPCETSVSFYRTTCCYIPENSTFHSHRCEDLKFPITMFEGACNWTLS
jgi:hypothetical protein